MKIEKIIYSLTPDEAFLIRMFYKGVELAKMCNRTQSHVNNILQGRKTFSGDLAIFFDKIKHECQANLDKKWEDKKNGK